MSAVRAALPCGHDPGLVARRGLLLVAGAAALTGVLAGLARLGISVGWGPSHAVEHGPLMVVGVFATVIALERAVALGSAWAFFAPAFGAATAVALLAAQAWAPWLACAAGAALGCVNLAIARRQSATFTWMMVAASIVLLLGNVAWASGRAVFEVVPAWIAFFVLTIVAERLELSRLAPTPRWASRALVVIATVLALAASAHLARAGNALRAFGTAMALLGAWQLRFDLARRTLRLSGLPRFSAASVMLGAAWLCANGGWLAFRDLPPAGPGYDAALHGVFVGFVLSMVLAHAPIILPAVARIDLPFHRSMWGATITLHVGLVVRVFGDLSGSVLLRQSGAALNAMALVVFVATVLVARLSAAKFGELHGRERRERAPSLERNRNHVDEIRIALRRGAGLGRLPRR